MSEIVTVFRNRLRPEASGGYAATSARMDALARAMPGHVDSKTFTAADGERVTVVTFADRASHARARPCARTWRRTHPMPPAGACS